MKTYRIALLAVGVLSVVALAMASLASSQDPAGADRGVDGISPDATCGFSPTETLATGTGGLKAAAWDPNTFFYVLAQDANTTTTVIHFINSSNVRGRGHLRVYDSGGVYQGGWWFELPPGGYGRMCADAIAAGVNQNFWFWNIGTYAHSYAVLELPPGVFADGYIAWNDGPTYDPTIAVQMLPLRLMSMPVQ